MTPAKQNYQRKLKVLARSLGRGELSFDPEVRKQNSGDKWFASHLPDAVAFPKSTESVSQILKFASKNNIPVTARGAGFGYVGGAVPEFGGIALSLNRMNRIKEINAGDFVAVVEPGVILKTLQDAVEKQGLYYPPDPASRADASVGGTVATNAGGPRCLKYGVTRDYVLGLEVVLADGSIARIGGRTHKNKTGFDLTRLFVGSEGMLGVITEATLKLIPLPPYRALIGAGFDSMKSAARAIRAIFAAGFLPCALEVADKFTLAAARKRTGSKKLEGCDAMILVELDGQQKSVAAELSSLEKIVRSFDPVMLQKALGADEVEKLWGLRREFSYSLRDTGLIKLNQDIVVPRGRLEELFQFAERLQKKYDVPVACFGHAGDGNIHCNVMYDPKWPNIEQRTQDALDDLFREVLAMGGSITGEHGIGLAKKRWWPLATSKEVRAMHKNIKAALDPKGLLNPGKFV
ncbi:MAG: glcD [Verrucomicrobiales bacterium]|nr:glcD [Verrucomicrobiales bacterium]